MVKTHSRQPAANSAGEGESSRRRASNASRDGANGRKLARGDAPPLGGIMQRARESVQRAFPHAAGQPVLFGTSLPPDHVNPVVLHLAATGEISEQAAERVRAHLRVCQRCAADLDELKRRLAS